jgi:hypothetical protein
MIYPSTKGSSRIDEVLFRSETEAIPEWNKR